MILRQGRNSKELSLNPAIAMGEISEGIQFTDINSITQAPIQIDSHDRGHKIQLQGRSQPAPNSFTH